MLLPNRHKIAVSKDLKLTKNTNFKSYTQN